MSATDNINPQQFMSVKELGQYESMDYPGKTMNQVHTMFRGRERRNPAFHNDMEDLRGSIEDYGIKTPLAIDPTGWTNGNTGQPMLGNGHHRFSAAKSLRLTEVPVSRVL